jgi:hypothetical protein
VDENNPLDAEGDQRDEPEALSIGRHVCLEKKKKGTKKI